LERCFALVVYINEPLKIVVSVNKHSSDGFHAVVGVCWCCLPEGRAPVGASSTCSAGRGPGLALVVVASVLVVDVAGAALELAQTVVGRSVT